MKKSDPNWKKFEKLIRDIQQELSPNAKVSHDIYLKGKNTQRQTNRCFN
jgi:hypothetical protein